MSDLEIYITRVVWSDGTDEELTPRTRGAVEAWLSARRQTTPYVVTYELVPVPQLALFAL